MPKINQFSRIGISLTEEDTEIISALRRHFERQVNKNLTITETVRQALRLAYAHTQRPVMKDKEAKQ